MNFSNFDFFVWDFDGCLVDSEPYHFESYRRAFADFNHAIFEEEYYPSFTHLGGGSAREIEKHNLTCSEQEIAEKKNIHYRKLIEEKAPPLFPYVREILGKIKQANGKLAIASNSPKEELETILKAQNSWEIFDLVIGRTENLPKKPDPAIFRKTLELLNATPEKTVIFEDAEKGLQAANTLGIQAIWIRTKINEKLKTTTPHIASLTHQEILTWVSSSK